MRAYRLHLGEEALVYRLAYKGDVVAFKMGRPRDPGWPISTRFRNVWHGRDALPRDPQQHGPLIVSGAAPPMVDAFRRVRACMCRRVFRHFCHAHSRVPIVFGPFHYCASCERAAPDAPETIDDQRRCTGCRDRTIYGGSRGSASLPPPAKWLGPVLQWIPTVQLQQKQRPSCRLF